MALVDNLNRRIDYLRVSVTDRCNLRCKYCMPACGITNKPHDELLSFEEIDKIVRIGVSLGIDKVRLTGGEPLVRKDIVALVEILARIEGLKDISMTTNGILLKDRIWQLKKAGLKRLNISLDTLKEDRYRDITRGGELKEVREAIRLSLEAGLQPLKINTLLLAGINDDEIIDFLRLTRDLPIHVRFLEFMPTRDNEFWGMGEKFMSYKEVMDSSRRLGPVEAVDIYGNGPAKVLRIRDAKGTFGFIAPMSERFCSSCNRLRLTSDGFLKGCLHSELKINLRDPIRRGMSEEGIIQLINLAVSTKSKGHSLRENPISSSEYLMCQIGG
ncbi:MAG: GTP 3',8-cyclase MoaA [Candidatus Omnitrophota bacterium]